MLFGGCIILENGAVAVGEDWRPHSRVPGALYFKPCKGAGGARQAKTKRAKVPSMGAMRQGQGPNISRKRVMEARDTYHLLELWA